MEKEKPETWSNTHSNIDAINLKLWLSSSSRKSVIAKRNYKWLNQNETILPRARKKMRLSSEDNDIIAEQDEWRKLRVDRKNNKAQIDWVKRRCSFYALITTCQKWGFRV